MRSPGNSLWRKAVRVRGDAGHAQPWRTRLAGQYAMRSKWVWAHRDSNPLYQ
jgi:hypothetical protein